jgi:thiol-disulfide isomerase/thioredoxin
MEAFISRISAEGPSEKRPPHILLESLSLRLVIAFLLAGAIGSALAGCDRQKGVEPQGEPRTAEAPEAGAAAGQAAYPTGRLDRSHAGTPAPGAVFEDPEGQPARMTAFRGRPVLVNLWATWCGPCVVEMPSLDGLARRRPDIQVLALSQDLNGRDKVSDFFAERDFARLEPYLDPEMGFMTALRIDTLPTTILYDAAGREVWRMTGMADWESERAVRLLGEAQAR